MEKEIMKKLQKERIMRLKTDLEIIIQNAPKEDNISQEENDVYSDINSLLDSITYFFYE